MRENGMRINDSHSTSDGGPKDEFKLREMVDTPQETHVCTVTRMVKGKRIIGAAVKKVKYKQTRKITHVEDKHGIYSIPNSIQSNVTALTNNREP